MGTEIETEKCENCGRALGGLENDVWRDSRVCRPCWQKLAAGEATPKRRRVGPGVVFGSYLVMCACLAGFLVSAFVFIIACGEMDMGSWSAVPLFLLAAAGAFGCVYGIWRAERAIH